MTDRDPGDVSPERSRKLLPSEEMFIQARRAQQEMKGYRRGLDDLDSLAKTHCRELNDVKKYLSMLIKLSRLIMSIRNTRVNRLMDTSQMMLSGSKELAAALLAMGTILPLKIKATPARLELKLSQGMIGHCHFLMPHLSCFVLLVSRGRNSVVNKKITILKIYVHSCARQSRLQIGRRPIGCRH